MSGKSMTGNSIRTVTGRARQDRRGFFQYSRRHGEDGSLCSW
jgi:hypothetical protein